MIQIKIAYNKNSESFARSIKNIFQENAEIFNEDIYKEKSKAWKLKGAYSAKQTPFAVIYYKDKPFKALYSENDGCNIQAIDDTLRMLVTLHAKKGYISIQKVKGKNNEFIPEGHIAQGFTETFMEGISCHIITANRWFKTSIITHIDWEKGEFTTLNSTYKFDFKDGSEEDRLQ